MEIEATTAAPEAPLAGTREADGDGVRGEETVFGTRPTRGRPHSIRLSGGTRGQAMRPASRAMDVLLGIGIGAAIMYYLDPLSGAQRRARVRDRIVGR
jgi:hypothetical protein